MMSTLKPHLFAEMLDILATDSWERWSSNTFLSWKLGYSRAICAFALSSVHAYEVVAYLLKNVLTKTSRIDNKYVVFNRNMAYTTHPMSFMMDERHHIKALMRMAGQYCTVVFDGESHTDLCEWQQPIFDGLENNEVISSTLALRNYNVIKTLDRGRKVHDVIALSPSHFFITHKLALIKNGLIKNLIVRPMVRLQLDGFKAWDGLKIERIEFPDNSGGIFRRDVLHPHRPQAAYLKSFIMKTQIVVANVIQMLKRHLFLKELEFSVAMFKNERSYDFDNVADYVLKVVKFRDTVFAKFKRQDPIQPAKRLNFEEALKDIQKKVNLLWTFMLKHPGEVISIKCGFEGFRFCRESNKLNTIRRCLSSEFVFEASEDGVTSGVNCHLLKTKASKTLEVIFYI